MATATYDLIASTTLGADAATIAFSSIPFTYTDLTVIAFLRQTSGFSASSMSVILNSDSGTNYSFTRIYGDGSTAGSTTTTNASSISLIQVAGVAGVYSMHRFNFFNYAGNTYKAYLEETSCDLNGTAAVNVERRAGLWRSTSAINAITFSFANFAANSSVNIYGIKAA
jgi:hypothetical protein